MKNLDLGKTQITDKVRVSSAAIFYENFPVDYYQFETFIFSDDPAIKSKQIIHGSSQILSTALAHKTKKVHGYVSNNLKSELEIKQ